MPKAQAVGHGHTSNQAPFQAAHVLKRNQACHQCRRRKLKCDAKRPCSTCVRSHSYAVAHAPAGAELPPHPDCTFDEVSETPETETVEAPKNRFERLESRINELEALLREKDRALNTFASDPVGLDGLATTTSSRAIPPDNADLGILPPFVPNASISSEDMSSIYGTFPSAKTMDVNGGMDYAQFPNGSSLDNLAGVATLLGNTPLATTPLQDVHMASTSTPSNAAETGASPAFAPHRQSLDLVFLSWPPNLPDQEVTRHLVEAYFAFHLHAVRLFHGPSFLASLDLHPTHPKFPCAAILHAMCAIGSLYTASIPPTPQPNDYPPYELFGSKLRTLERRADSFAEQQAKYAKQALEASMDVGQDTFQCVQVSVMLTWFYWCHGRWSEAFLSAATALRVAVPCGLNVCPPFHTITETLRPPSILPPAKTVIEDEMRRNSFWLAYAMERQMGTGNGWALSLDDQDVCQLLPLRGDHFEQGVLVYPSERQWSHDKDVLLVHRERQIDSFILYIKSTILLSRVKSFNLRFKGKHYSGDASMISPNNSPASGDQADYFDVKEAPAFRELEHIIAMFKASFPPHLKNPIDGHAVDPYLYTACLVPHLAQILLNEPHARPGTASCAHAHRILKASRAIVDLIYSISATSYDVSLLGLHAIMCWFIAGRVLVRFLKAAMDSNSEEQMIPLQAEIFFIRSMVSKAGERIFLAKRYKKMLDDYLFSSCGQQFMDPAPAPPPANISSTRDDYGVDMRPNVYDASRSTLDMYMQYKAPPMPPPIRRPMPS